MQKSYCPQWHYVGSRTGSLEDGHKCLVQGAVHLPPLPLEEVPFHLWDTCVGQSRGRLQDTFRPPGLWRRMTWITKLRVRTYCVRGNKTSLTSHVLLSVHNPFLLFTSSVDSSESSGESVSGFSSSSQSYNSAVGGEVEDLASVCASIITVKEPAGTSGALHKHNVRADSPEKTLPPQTGPKPQHQACGKV